MEKSNSGWHLPGAMIALLRKTACENIKRDFSLISSEYPFWAQLPEKDKHNLAKILFNHMLPNLTTLLDGSEHAFINNFMVSLSFRCDYAGEVIQYGSHDYTDMYIVWKGCVIVTELTEFNEPLTVYHKGTAFNLYQIMMDKKLPFDYRAICEDEFI